MNITDGLKKVLELKQKAHDTYNEYCSNFLTFNKDIINQYYVDVKAIKDRYPDNYGYYDLRMDYSYDPTHHTSPILSIHGDDLCLEWYDRDGDASASYIPLSYLNGDKDLSRVEKIFKDRKEEGEAKTRKEKVYQYERLKGELGL